MALNFSTQVPISVAYQNVEGVPPATPPATPPVTEPVKPQTEEQKKESAKAVADTAEAAQKTPDPSPKPAEATIWEKGKDILGSILSFGAKKEEQTDAVTDNILATANTFSIGQYDSAGVIKKVFNFALLPAIESKLGGGSSQVPEVKPGILRRVSQNIKTFELPGGVPAFQVLGLSATMFQLVGLLVGAEDVKTGEGSVNKTNSKGVEALYRPSARLDAEYYAAYFESEFIQSGRPVEIVIVSTSTSVTSSQLYNSNPFPWDRGNNGKSISGKFTNTVNMGSSDASIVLSYSALLQNFRYFITRSDRVYYAIDALILDYQKLPSTSR